MNHPITNDVMDRLAAGDGEALGELYDRYAGIVRGIARRIVQDDGEAEDVVQTVFLQAWRQAARFDAGRGTAVAWLATLARTRALDSLRARLSWRQATRNAVGEVVSPVEVERVAVHQALRTLPDVQRQTIELAYYEGLTQTEIADRLGQPVGTIKTRVRAALKRLRSTLEPAYLPGA